MRINGFEQIKSFYSWVFNNPDKVRPTHISLYLFLWNQGNRANWVEWFKCPYDLAMQGACIGNKGTYYRCLDDLQNYELIKYKKGLNNYKAPQIHLIKLYDSVPLSEQVTVPLSEQLSEPLTELLSGNIYKLITNNYKLVNNKLKYWISLENDNVNIIYKEDIHKCLSDCLNYFPKHLHPKKENTWLETIEKLNRIDKIPLDKIVEIVKKTRNDEFWSKNFLSLTKLRKKNKEGIMYIVVFNERIKKTFDVAEHLQKKYGGIS